jgi:hypothetical protein
MSRLPADTVGGRSSTLNLGVEGGNRPTVILRDAQVLPPCAPSSKTGCCATSTKPARASPSPSVPADVATNGSTPPPVPPSTSIPGGPSPLGDAEAAELTAALVEVAADT